MRRIYGQGKISYFFQTLVYKVKLIESHGQKKHFGTTSFNPIQYVGQKGPPTSFFPVTSTNITISLRNILTFSFNPFAT